MLHLFSWAVILSAIISTLLSYGVLDRRNRAVWSIADFLYRITDPFLRPIRQILPDLGGIDISPWLLLILLQMVVIPLLGGLQRGLVYGIWQPLS
jgi:YggT family protein